jgi:hypothetical protein
VAALEFTLSPLRIPHLDPGPASRTLDETSSREGHGRDRVDHLGASAHTSAYQHGRRILSARLVHPSSQLGEPDPQYDDVQLPMLTSGHEGIRMLDSRASIVLHRKVRWASATIRLTVLADDQEVAKLRIGKTVAIDVSPGLHFVKVMYRNREVKYRNREGALPVTVGPNGTVRVNLWMTSHPFRVMLVAMSFLQRRD